MEFESVTEKTGEYMLTDLSGLGSGEEDERVGLVSPTNSAKKSTKTQHRRRFSSRPELALLDVSY